MVDLRKALHDAACSDEVVTPIAPERLEQGRWWNAETPWPEALRAGLLEPKRGYRYRPENLALASLLVGREVRSLCDLGTGTGSLLLIGAHLTQASTVVGVERQPEMVERTRRSLAVHDRHCPWLGAAHLVEGDLRAESTLQAAREVLGGGADLVVANPPFFPAEWGRPSKDPSTHTSTHAVHGGVLEFLHAARAMVHAGGRVLMVYDAQRVAELLAAASEAGLGPVAARWIADQREGHENVPFRVWIELSAEAPRWSRL